MATPQLPVRQLPVGFLPRESHGQSSLADYDPSDHKESDRTEKPEHMHAQLIYNVVLFTAILQSDSVIQIYTFFLKNILLWFIIAYQTQFSVLYCRTLLLIHSICKSLHLLTHFIPLLPLPPWQSPVWIFLNKKLIHCVFLNHIMCL